MLFKSEWITYKTGEPVTMHDKYGNPPPYFRHRYKTNGDIKKQPYTHRHLEYIKYT